MDAHAFNPDEFRKHLKGYWVIFGALLVLTALTVGVSYLHLSTFWTIVVALVVASTKGTLVALYFMHLLDEKKLIYWTLLLAAVLFVPLLALPNLTEGEVGEHRVKIEKKAAPEGHGSEGAHH